MKTKQVSLCLPAAGLDLDSPFEYRIRPDSFPQDVRSQSYQQ